MVRLFSRVTAFVYKRAAKPILFRLAPDGVHTRMIISARMVQKIPLLPQTVAAIWAYRNTARLSQQIHGLTFINPIGLSAGLDKNAEIVPVVKAIGFGFATIGSVTHEPCSGNPRPWFFRLPRSQALVVHVGLANHGVKRIIQRINRYSPRLFRCFPLVVSVAKTNSTVACTDTGAIADYVASLKLIKMQTAAAVVELNISCPNTYGGEPFTTPERLSQLLKAVDAVELNKPLWVKMPLNLSWKEFDALLKVLTQHTVAGVTIANLNKDRRAVNPADGLTDATPGNLGGRLNTQLCNELISKTYQSYGDRLCIIGVGGVFSAEDAYEKIKRGAHLVDMITGLIFNGPQVVGQINYDLAQLVARDGYRNVSEAVGAYHRTHKT